MADLVENIVTREGKGSPLAPAEMDSNLTVLKNAVNGLAARLGVTLNADGSLKDNAILRAAQISDGVITPAKFGFTFGEYAGTLPSAETLADADKVSGILAADSSGATFTLEQIKTFVQRSAATIFTSANIAIEDTFGSEDHGLNAVPDLVLATIICVTAQHNYAVNNEVPVGQITINADEIDYPPCTVRFNSTSIGWTMGTTTAWTILDAGESAIRTITAANWRLKIRAFKFV